MAPPQSLYFLIAFTEYTIGIFPSMPLIRQLPSLPAIILLKHG
jgi:hypothetical protein